MKSRFNLLIVSITFLAILAGCQSKAKDLGPIFSKSVQQYENGNFQEAEVSLKASLKLAEKETTSREQVSQYVLMLAGCYLQTNQLDIALTTADQALALACSRWGADSRQVFPYYLTRVKILYKRKEFKLAQAAAQELLARQEKVLGKDAEELIETLNLVIASACAEDRCADTTQYLLRQLKLKERYLGKDHEYVAASLGQLAEIEEKKGNLDKAKTLYMRALAIRKKSAPHLVESSEKNLVRIKLKQLNQGKD